IICLFIMCFVFLLFLFFFFIFFFFFFQAEDGIRDRTVTGVQTCALPISKGIGVFRFAFALGVADLARDGQRWGGMPDCIRVQNRSEERRVGKECRCRWWTYH